MPLLPLTKVESTKEVSITVLRCKEIKTMTDLFHQTIDGKLDRKYLRVCSVYKLLMRQHRITKDRAIELLEQRKVKPAKATVELWLAYPPPPRSA
jgi:hypothetical protein